VSSLRCLALVAGFIAVGAQLYWFCLLYDDALIFGQYYRNFRKIVFIG